MDVGADGMSGAVNEIIAEALLLDVAASGAVYFPSGDAAPGVDCIGHGFYAGVASVAHNLENLAHAAGRRLADKTHPRDVVIHCSGCIFLPPNVEQDQIAFVNGNRMVVARLVLRLSVVGLYVYDWRPVRLKILAAK